jgi:serine/threonine-protein kinase
MSDLAERLTAALGDRYAVASEIGRGGMATVFLAEDLKHHRQVAIKVLHPELAASIGPDRFLREIEAVAGLTHPHVLPLYDSGTAGGLLFYTMPYVEGESLRQRLERESQLPLEEAVRITREVAEGLDHAHRHGLVHRDIKPANILLEEGHAVVADFGVAKALSQAAGETMTATGMAVGTPAYMSPEQAAGQEVDARSDIYSLGCILYEMLAGEPPLAGMTPQSTAAKRLTDRPTPLVAMRNTVPDKLQSLVEQTLAVSPADRPATAGRLAEELAGAMQIPESNAQSLPTPRWLIPTLSFTVVAALAAIAASIWVIASGGRLIRPDADRAAAGRSPEPTVGLESTRDLRRIAVLYFEPRSRQEEVPYVAAGLTEGLIDELSSISQLSVVSRNGVAGYRGTALPPDSIGRALDVGTLVDGTVALSEDRVRVNVTFVNASTGEQFGRTLVERPRTEIFELQDDLVVEVAAFLRTRLGDELDLIERHAVTEDVEAWELVQRARSASEQSEALSRAGDVDAAWTWLGIADSLYAEAEREASGWVEPIVQRGWVAYTRSRWSGVTEQAAAAPWIEDGMARAQSALQRQPEHADALELRGTLRYWRWLLRLEPDPAAADRLFQGAEADFRASIQANSNQAGAWATLSHLLINKAETAEAKMAAARAYRADAYLRNADVILWRLYTTSYDLENLPEAGHWCSELGRRFPDDDRFVECQLWQMTMHDAEIDVDRAWGLEKALIATRPGQEVEFSRRWSGMGVAAVLARAGLPDSARAVAYRSRGDASVDPTRDLVYVEAFVRTLLGDREEAIDLLAEFMAATSGAPSDIDYWWFNDLREEPGYQALLGVAGE